MRPFLELLPWEEGSSVCLLDRKLDDEIPFQWHHHPEYELTLTVNSKGQRFIADHVGTYADNDLVLVGPNLAHTWHSSSGIKRDEPHQAKVIWFGQDVVQMFASSPRELLPIKQMLDQGRAGLAFSPQPKTLSVIRALFDEMFVAKPEQRIFVLMRLLQNLADNVTSEPLASQVSQAEQPMLGHDRLDRVLTYIHLNYAAPLRMETLGQEAALSVSALHRAFLRYTNLTISQYVRRLRIGDACAQLSGTQKPIAHIAQSVGYDSLTNFNRQFKAVRAMTPRQYRAHFQNLDQ